MKARTAEVLPQRTSSAVGPPVGALDRAFRRAVLARLALLTDGEVTLRDGSIVRHFGDRCPADGNENEGAGARTSPGARAVAGTGARNEATPGARAGAGGPPGEVRHAHVTLTVNDASFYRSVALRAGLGAAEAYVRGAWSCDDLTGLLRIFVRNIRRGTRVETRRSALLDPVLRLGLWLRRNTLEGSRRNIHAHYDLGNEFFALFLDETMTYSCGIFAEDRHVHASSGPQEQSAPALDSGTLLRNASLEKYDRICRKLRLSPADHVVEIGSGWGGFALHAAGRYGCRVTTTTISQEQCDYVQRRIVESRLSDRVDVCLEDYRALKGRYDALVSIEMIEAVGEQFLDAYFEKCSDLLLPDGRMALQAIVMPDQEYERYRRSVDVIRRYVFPGSFLPSLGAIQSSVGRRTDLRVENVEDIRPHYARTLRLWRERLWARLDEARALGYDEPFLRLWEYYFCYCEAGFAERYIGDVQIVLAKPQCRQESYLP